jgi:hypothetical protein
MNIWMAVFWDFAPCSLVEINPKFQRYVESSRVTSETPVYFYQTAQHSIPEDSHLRFLLVVNMFTLQKRVWNRFPYHRQAAL